MFSTFSSFPSPIVEVVGPLLAKIRAWLMLLVIIWLMFLIAGCAIVITARISSLLRTCRSHSYAGW